MSSTHIKYT